MSMFDNLPADVSAETMRGVHEVLREWLFANTGLNIWYDSGAWRVVDDSEFLNMDVSAEEFKAQAERATKHKGYSYAECLKFLLHKIDVPE